MLHLLLTHFYAVYLFVYYHFSETSGIPVPASCLKWFHSLVFYVTQKIFTLVLLVC